ncbi:aromatic aminotransferase [Colletotrichum chrysophilum]|uniref:Aromatic aminotransferase n=1 Tax=Colletotrichum chrysophilum TaxID=1836956 RepID=A0AAD9EQD0_9PEZI|nr:aromatic aminotransferase [Colletotrichum chrysophilum]
MFWEPTMSTHLDHRLASIEARRAAAPPLPGGSGPHTSSFHFREPPSDEKPKAKRWDHRLSIEALTQFTSELKIASRGGDPTGKAPKISLGTGRPAPQYFPFISIQMNAMNTPQDAALGTINAEPTMVCAKGEAAYDLDIAMNYGYSAGSPQFLRWITEHTELVHSPPYADWESIITCGTTSAIELAFRLLCDRGDCILVEQYSYPGSVTTAKCLGLQILGIKLDDLGLCPDDLDRRKAIYNIAEKHDLYILEDDPYFFLHLGEISDQSCGLDQGLEVWLRQLPQSYLSLDVSGRVMRMDTTSKMVAPGLRLGWITASSQVVEKFVKQMESGPLAPSGVSQAMAYKLLDEFWGHKGLFNWLHRLSAEYRHRRDVLHRACQRYLPLEISHWATPVSGMFLWIEFRLSQHAAAGDYDAVLMVEDNIYNSALSNGVLVSRGSWFATDLDLDKVCFRLSFANASDEEFDIAVGCLASAAKEQLQPS